jgi:hypothetical protein
MPQMYFIYSMFVVKIGKLKLLFFFFAECGTMQSISAKTAIAKHTETLYSAIHFGHLTYSMPNLAPPFQGILAVLRRDNLCDEIAPEHRDALEMDVRGAATSGRFTVARDLVANVRALNVAKRVLTGAHDLGSSVANLGAPGALQGVLVVSHRKDLPTDLFHSRK